MRLHFTKLELKNSRYYLYIRDKDGNKLATYQANNEFFEEDMWTEWFTGDTIKVNLKTNEIGTAYGF